MSFMDNINFISCDIVIISAFKKMKILLNCVNHVQKSGSNTTDLVEDVYTDDQPY